MAGGLGTRLRPFTAVIPKPLVPIDDMSVIEMILRQLSYYGFERVKICVGYKAEIIMAVVGDGARFGLDVTYHLERESRGTIGALSDIEDFDENFLVMNGDLCTSMNFGEMLDAHVASHTTATVGCRRQSEKLELGVIDVDESGRFIQAFREKPVLDLMVAMGVNAFHKSVIEFIPPQEPFGFDSLVHKLLANSVPIRIFPFCGVWFDIGRPDDYDQMLDHFRANRELYLPGMG